MVDHRENLTQVAREAYYANTLERRPVHFDCIPSVVERRVIERLYQRMQAAEYVFPKARVGEVSCRDEHAPELVGCKTDGGGMIL